MNTPQYLMTAEDKQYVRLGELAARDIPKTSLIDFSFLEIKAAGMNRYHFYRHLTALSLLPCA